MAVINVKKDVNPVNGSVGNDEINLKESIGNGIVINANAGNDIINVTRGDNHTINAGAGADFVTVASGKNYKIDLGEGNDRVDLLGAEGHQVIAVSGTNNLNVNSGSNYVITGGTGIDRLTIKGTNSNIYADLGEGDDVLGMATGSGNEVHGGDGKDYFIVSGGEASIFYGDDGNDTLRLYRGEGHTLYAGTGDDSMLVTEANNSKVYGVSGKNQIMFFGGTGNEYHGGDEKDNITLKNKAEAVKIIGGSKATVVNIQVGNNHIVDLSNSINTVTQIMAGSGTNVTGSKGKDTLSIWGTTDSLTADLGNGNDIVKVKAGTGMTINGGAGADEFRISGGSGNRYDTGAGNDLIEDNGKKSFVIADTGDDKLTIGMNTNEGTYYGGAGNDTISVSGGRNIVYGDYNNNNGYKFDAAGTTYNDIITLEANSYTNKIYAGKGNDTIDMKSYYTNEVYAGDGDDTIYVSTEYYDRDRNDIYSYNPYAKVSGGAGNDTFKVTGSWNTDTVLLFGGSGNDTFELNTDMYFAYGGAGDDTFYINNHHDNQFLTGGAGNDTYYVELSESSKYEAGGTKTLFFNIDNSLYHEASDADTLKIIGADGKLENMKLSYYGIHDVVPTYWLEFSTDTGSYCFNIKGFEHLALQFQDTNGKWTNYNSGLELQQELEKIGNSRYSAISLFDWNFYYDSYYGGAIERTFGSVDDFMSREADFKVYGNGK